MVNRMEFMSAFASQKGKKRLPKGMADMIAVDTRVPEFHNEFLRGGCWPTECDAKAGYQFLCDAYENARTIASVRMNLIEKNLEVCNTIQG